MKTIWMVTLSAMALLAQGPTASRPNDHVHWSLTLDLGSVAPGHDTVGKLTAQVDSGWHLYSLSTPPGPIPTTIKLASNAAIGKVRIFQPAPDRKFDANFNADTETFTGAPIFLLQFTVNASASGSSEITALARYQVCSDTVCIPPVTRAASAKLTIDSAASTPLPALPAGYKEFTGTSTSSAPRPAADSSLGGFLLLAFGFGLASIFTPCVFPMIPITMSFFLNQKNVTRRDTIIQALIFCLGIIVLFTGLGLLATSLLGPFGVVQLGSNPWVNGLIAVIFLIFGLSLLGAFEITIPSSILTKLDSASQKGGYLGTLVMGLTFSLASFACVGPFVGTLLAASVQGGGSRPLLGMAGFSTGLALPFFLLAIFPAYLKKLPRSGGWLARVKVVMGFVILAAMLKYVSSIDQVLQWGFLTRERFLAAWIVLFAMAGLYLLGLLRMEGVSKDDNVTLGRLLVGIAFLIFSISLVPGIFGAGLGELDSYVPVAKGSASLGGGSSEKLVWLENDLDGALARARSEKKLVLVNFTGYACTNCHWMKANMFNQPDIASAMKGMILVDLYTDGTDAASQANQKLEEGKFGTIAIPYYVLYDPGASNDAARVLASFPGLTRKPAEYLAFLNTSVSAAATVSVTNASPFGPFTTLGGSPFDATPLRNKVVVLNFWATWCVPCRQEIPAFNKMQAQLGPRGLTVLGVSLDEDGAPVVTPFLKSNPIEYTLALGAPKVAELNTQFKIDQLPVTLIYDRSGKLLQRFEGFTKADAIQSVVDRAL